MKRISLFVSATIVALGLVFTGASSASASLTHTFDPRTIQHHAVPFAGQTKVVDHGDHTYTLTWNAPGVSSVKIYTGTQQQVIGLPRYQVAAGGGSGEVTVTVPGNADRQWFMFVPNRGLPLTLADRLVRLDGTVNLRDVGGYRTSNGQWVQMGKVYRSDAFDKITDADKAKLQRLGITLDIDLRTSSERTSAPDKLWPGARYQVEDVLGDTGSLTNVKTPEDAAAAMEQINAQMATSDRANKAFSDTFHAISQNPGATVFHCTAGKDRTGWMASALLTLLGVDSNTVMSDYLASNDYRAAANAATLAQLPPSYRAIYKAFLDVRSEYLNAGITALQAKYGSYDGYFSTGLGVSTPEAYWLQLRLLWG